MTLFDFGWYGLVLDHYIILGLHGILRYGQAALPYRRFVLDRNRRKPIVEDLLQSFVVDLPIPLVELRGLGILDLRD